MKLLAIDSSGLVASVALLCDDILVGEYTIHNKKTHSQTLLPMIADMLDMAEVDKHDLTAIAVAAGPGSFTGLRIGASTAKGMAQALSIPIVPVSTLEGLAFGLQGVETLVCPIMDARRSQAYFGIYEVDGEKPVALVNEGAEPIEEILSKLRELDRPVTFLGDGVPVFRERICEFFGVKLSRTASPDGLAEEGLPGKGSTVRFASDAVRYLRASSIAALGRIVLREGKEIPAEEFTPVYLRQSQAERERKTLLFTAEQKTETQ